MTKKKTGQERENRLRAIGDITDSKPAEQALQELEEQWRSLVENIPDIMMTVDADGTILFVNRTVLGLTVEGVIGTSLYDYLPPEHHDMQRKLLGKVFESGEAHGYEIAGTGPFGRASWYFSRIGPIMRDGRVVAAVLITTDITEQRRAEEALRESEERYRRLVQDSIDGIVVAEGPEIRFVNSALLSIFGCQSEEEMVGRPFTDFVSPEYREFLLERNCAREQGQVVPAHYEFKALRKDGSTFDAEVSIGRVGHQGRTVTQAVVRDIAERKQAEEALREAEGRFRSLVEASPDAITLTDLNTNIIMANDQTARLHGYDRPEDMIGRSAFDLIAPEDRERAVENAQKALETGTVRNVEYTLLRKDGTRFPAELSASLIVDAVGNPVAFTAVTRDITDRKQAEEALSREAELNSSFAAVSRALIQSRPVDDIAQLVLECAKDVTDSPFGYVAYIDPQTGYLVSPTLTKDIWDACEVPDKDVVFKEFSGLWGWVLLNRKPLLTNAPADDPRSSGTPPGHLPVNRFLSAPALIGARLVGQVAVGNSQRDYAERDLRLVERLAMLYALALERKQAEEALWESENRYRDLVERLPYAVAVHSEEKVVFVNSAGVQLFGAAAPDEIIGRPIWDFVHPDHLKAVTKRIRRVWPRGKKIDLVEERLIRLDGQVIDVEMAAIPITYRGEAARQVVLRDITEGKRMEEALQSAREELENTVERQMQRGSAYGLTFRELTVLHLMADGRSDREIGTVLGISTLTAKKHVENILAKMKASCRTEASVRAIREGLLD